MADRTQLKIADRNTVTDDDPFAELTRIMGFDPRQPARPQEGAKPRDASADAPSDDDFEIDLEKEMMGDFGAEDGIGDDNDAYGAIASEIAAPEAELAASDLTAPDFEDEMAASLDQDFQLDAGRFDDGSTPDADAAMAESEPLLEAAPEPEFDDVFASSEDVFANSLEDELELDADAAQAGLVAQPLPETASGPAFAQPLDDEPEADADTPVAAAEAMPEHAFDHAVARSLDDDRSFEEELRIEADPPEDGDLLWEGDLAEEGAGDFSAAETHDEPMPAKAAQDHDFDGHFDAAMADVDMDFDARPDLRSSVSEVGDIDASDDDAEDDAAMAAGAAPDGDIDLDLQDALDAELAGEPVAQAEPAAPAAAFGRQDNSLEDELNALLGNMGARAGAAGAAAASWRPKAAAVEQTPAQPDAEDEQPIVDHLGITRHETAAVEYPAAASPADDAGLDDLLAEELNAGDFSAASAIEPVAPLDPVALPEPVAQSVVDVDFDADDAFQAAFAAGIDLPDEAAASGTDTAADEVPAAASFAAPVHSWNRVTPVTRSQPASAYPDERVEDEAGHSEPAPAGYGEVPDVETVDVPERVVALADDLDIPDLAFEDDQPSAGKYDDIEAEFANFISEMGETSAAEAAAASRVGSYDDEAYEAGFRRVYQQDQGNARPGPAQGPAVAAAPYAEGGAGLADLAGDRPFATADSFAADEFDQDPEFDETIAAPFVADAEAARQPRGRGLFVAAVIGAVAIAGGLGAFALSLGGDSGSDAPVIVKADNAPIKVKPENPGGTVVPNQDNKVYDAVNGIQPASPEQKKLVTNNEEPVDVTAAEPQSRVVDLSPDTVDEAVAAAPAPKSEDRIEQTAQKADETVNPAAAVVAPRKVRTMIVKADGSLVPREDTEPAAQQIAATEPTDPAPQHVIDPSTQADTQHQTGAVPSAAAKAADGADNAQAAPKARAQSATTPAMAPVAPSRPAEQPLDIVGEVKPDKVASINPSTPAAAAGSWSMQIASQPSVESAKSTYQDLARRYGSVLEGHAVNIVKADIAGKGTFYRVRVPAQSRNDAINLCTSYKAAGGNCFVSK